MDGESSDGEFTAEDIFGNARTDEAEGVEEAVNTAISVTSSELAEGLAELNEEKVAFIFA